MPYGWPFASLWEAVDEQLAFVVQSCVYGGGLGMRRVVAGVQAGGGSQAAKLGQWPTHDTI